MNRLRTSLWMLIALGTVLAGCKGPPPTSPMVIAREPNQLLWGDTHVHANDPNEAPGSMDANTAYRWARGIPVLHPQTRAKLQLQRPLDFLVVDDDAEGLSESARDAVVDAADRNNVPCSFTTLVGWELSGELEPGGADASARGLTAVWAEENTRTSISNAFERKEVYTTTGPRIRLRFFGGWSFTHKQAPKANMVLTGYLKGHPMGSQLTNAPEDDAPTFLMYAIKDPDGANLDRMQLIKAWVDADGKTHERVYDVAWSAGREPGPDGEVPPIENMVDLATGQYDRDAGAAALHGFWSDPDFVPDQRAFYYVRVLQIPTPRYALDDAASGETDPAETERAYSSPIWYSPKGY